MTVSAWVNPHRQQRQPGTWSGSSRWDAGRRRPAAGSAVPQTATVAHSSVAACGSRPRSPTRRPARQLLVHVALPTTAPTIRLYVDGAPGDVDAGRPRRLQPTGSTSGRRSAATPGPSVRGASTASHRRSRRLRDGAHPTQIASLHARRRRRDPAGWVPHRPGRRRRTDLGATRHRGRARRRRPEEDPVTGPGGAYTGTPENAGGWHLRSPLRIRRPLRLQPRPVRRAPPEMDTGAVQHRPHPAPLGTRPSTATSTTPGSPTTAA